MESLTCSLTKVLVPSVGLCVHPWLFADCGMHVIATDIAATALASIQGQHLKGGTLMHVPCMRAKEILTDSHECQTFRTKMSEIR